MVDISVTAVGGTEYVPEVAVYFSGGGFSDYVSPLATILWIKLNKIPPISGTGLYTRPKLSPSS